MVTCLEVLEHLIGDDLLLAVNNIKKLCKPGGVIFISVPLEQGLSALVKNSVRLAIGKTHGATSIANVTRSALGRMDLVEREAPVDGYVSSHIGFDFRIVEADLFREYTLIESQFTPIQLFGSILNSQANYLFRKA